MPRTPPKARKHLVSAQHGDTVIYERLLEGGYQVIVPALAGIVTYGRTIDEARDMAEDAVRCHLRALLRDGEEILFKSIVRQAGLTNQEFFQLIGK
jgi:predicted RNase H-like HicB family nuclease